MDISTSINSPNDLYSRSQLTVISFTYVSYKHDPFPILFMVGPIRNNKAFGLNLHYLPFAVYRKLLYSFLYNPKDHKFINTDPLLKNAFRSYRLESIKNARKVDWQMMIRMMDFVKNYSAQEIALIKNAVEQQASIKSPNILNNLMQNMNI